MHFKDFFDAYSLFSKPMKSKSLLKIYLFSLVISYKHYEADTEADKVEPHVSSCMVFYCNGWRTDRFDNLSAKGFNLHWCKSNFRRPVEQNLFCISSSNWL